MKNTTDQYKDAVTVAPDIHKVIFENDKIRVLEVTVKPGDKVGMHTNPENINYIIKPGKLRLIEPSGETIEVDLTARQVIPAPEGAHAVENIGDSEVQTICIELKNE
jgi:quercetin dioxygenase-like cupin family protein